MTAARGPEPGPVSRGRSRAQERPCRGDGREDGAARRPRRWSTDLARRLALLAGVGAAAAAGGCSEDGPACDPPSDFGCPPERACEEVSGSGPRCVTPLVARGKITDLATGQPLSGARVLAVNEDDVPLAAAAVTGPDGSYEIRLPSPRDAQQRPVSSRLRLRAAALGHGSFPDEWRDWPVLDEAAATVPQSDDRYILVTQDSNPALVPLAGGPGRGILSGTVPRPPDGAPVLVVAENDREILGRPRGVAAWADRAGGYVIFGLASGQHRVRAYARGASYGERSITLDVGDQTARLDLSLDPGQPAATVSGRAEAGAGSGTAFLSLVVASTWFEPTSGGQDLGIRAAVGADGSYAFSGVPAGTYVVVDRDADGHVPLDPPATVVVAGADVTVEGTLRLAAALAVIAPGAERPEGVSPRPTISWGDHPSEDHYDVDVVNAAGLTVLTRTEPAHGGSSPSLVVDVPLAPGQLYRFRAQARAADGALLGKTEDRRGVFFLVE